MATFEVVQIVTSDLDTGLTFRFEQPQEVGADRIVNAAAAYARYGGPIIIVDFGTAMTFCVVTEEGGNDATGRFNG